MRLEVRIEGTPSCSNPSSLCAAYPLTLDMVVAFLAADQPASAVASVADKKDRHTVGTAAACRHLSAAVLFAVVVSLRLDVHDRLLVLGYGCALHPTS